MRSITEIITPVKLLSGTHSDTATTGQGCFMNVIAYLNGESQITDQSQCVCVTIRPIAIWLNDTLQNEDRHKLLPFLERAMGSATEDRAVINARLAFIVKFAQDCTESAKYAEYAAESAKYAAGSAAKYAAESAKYAAGSAAKYAAGSAKYAKSARIIGLALKLMDDICPKPQTHKSEIYERAEKIVSLQGCEL